jgi:hypothetical protein
VVSFPRHHTRNSRLSLSREIDVLGSLTGTLIQKSTLKSTLDTRAITAMPTGPLVGAGRLVDVVQGS